MKFQKNEIVTVTIEDIGSEGEGIGKADGFPLFIKDAVVGDTVEARIVKPKENYAYARLEKVVTPSPFRVEPPCPYHRQCGGCQLQALSYGKQLEYKQNKIRNHLKRIGGFDDKLLDSVMEPIVGMDDPFRYRNKAQYPVGADREGRIITGFYAGRTHHIIANTNCLLGAEENEEILNIVLDYMNRHHITAYDEQTGKGLVRHVLIRKGFTSGEMMVCLVINKKMTYVSKNGFTEKKTGRSIGAENEMCVEGRQRKADRQKAVGTGKEFREAVGKGRGIRGEISKNDKLSREEDNQFRENEKKEFLPFQQDLLEKLAGIKGMTSVSVSINTQNTNVIMGNEVHCIWGSPTISDTIHVRDMSREDFPFTGKSLTFHISPLSFYQVNPVQTEKLYSLALEYAGLTGKETVWDLYCGIGTISLFLAAKAKKVYGVEIVPQAIEDARENAVRNGIGNAEFFVGKAEEVLPEKYRVDGIYADVIVVDPPRKGCDEACLDTMLEMRPERIVYVSCDSATLARDVRRLCDGGYEISKVRGVDQFGMTGHVETVALLTRKS